MTALTNQIIAKAARLIQDELAYDGLTENQRACVSEICLSGSLTEERAVALWDTFCNIEKAEAAVIVRISNVNVNNEHRVNEIAGIAGYVGSVRAIDFGIKEIALGSASHRKSAGIPDSDIAAMLTAFVMEGFIIERLYVN